MKGLPMSFFTHGKDLRIYVFYLSVELFYLVPTPVDPDDQRQTGEQSYPRDRFFHSVRDFSHTCLRNNYSSFLHFQSYIFFRRHIV